MKRIMVTRSSMPEFEEYIDEIKDIWDSHWMTNMGKKHNELEKELCDYLEIPYISLFTNGHMALELGIQALNLSGEVITTPFTFASTTHAIVRNGLTPVFCDINPTDYTIDGNMIESLITEKTSAIVPVHVYGNVCNVEQIQKIADKYNLKIIYDAAHAFGVKYKNIGIGNYGDLSIFSFHATKVFNTIEGGAATYADETIGKMLYKLKNFGIRSEEIVDGVGANAKMNEFQAAMGLCNLRHIQEDIRVRKERYDKYMEELADISGIILPCQQDNVEKNYSYFPIRVDEKRFGKNRDEVSDLLAEQGVYVRKYFYPITSAFECYRDRYDSEKTPVAKRISEEILTLPLYTDLRMDDVSFICGKIREMKV